MDGFNGFKEPSWALKLEVLNIEVCISINGLRFYKGLRFLAKAFHSMLYKGFLISKNSLAVIDCTWKYFPTLILQQKPGVPLC